MWPETPIQAIAFLVACFALGCSLTWSAIYVWRLQGRHQRLQQRRQQRLTVIELDESPVGSFLDQQIADLEMELNDDAVSKGLIRRDTGVPEYSRPKPRPPGGTRVFRPKPESELEQRPFP